MNEYDISSLRVNDLTLYGQWCSFQSQKNGTPNPIPVETSKLAKY
jgi:hypothetical protein